MTLELALLALASLLAGLVDSIVGGGGLILVPALFAVFPSAPPPTLLGTNKIAAIWGTLIASARFAKQVSLQWRFLLPAAAFALLGSWSGAWVVTQTDPSYLRKLLPLILIAVLIYTLWNKNLGQHHKPLHSGVNELAVICSIGILIGFYDGFFGPGAGSFFVFLLVRLLGYDFLNASASAKVLNTATNFAALALFAWKGHVWWQIGMMLAVANIMGSIVGSYLALKHGASFVRYVFIAVVGMLTIKTGYDAFLR
jgi:uncharacterized protein